MAAPRTYWKGHLRLSLVSIDVALYSATDRSSTISLRQIHRPSGKPVRYQKIAPGVGPVDDDEIVKGFDIGDDSYVVLERDELDEIKLESRRAIRLIQFVDHHEVDPRYYDKPYYVAPQGEAAAEGFVVIREALRKANKVGLGQMTMRGREHLVAIRPCGDGLLLETLRYGDEVRAADAVFDDIPDLAVDDDMLGLAEQLIEQKSGRFHPGAFRDSYAAALRELIERKRKGKAVIAAGDEPPRKGGEVVDLMEALKKSLGQGGGKTAPARRSAGSSRGKAPPRRKAG